MTLDRLKKVLQKAEEQVGELLEDQLDDIHDGFTKGLHDHDKDAAFAFALAVGIKITDEGAGYKVKTALRWTEKHQVDTEAEVSAQGDMLEDAAPEPAAVSA